MKLFGYTLDKQNNPVAGATVELKDFHFQTQHQTFSDENGYYEISAEDRRFPFLIAVKDYAVHNLEYWCQNLDLTVDRRLDMRFDMLEVYGLHAFSVKGGREALMVYFRPMSLPKFRRKEADLAPMLKEIRTTLDGEVVQVLVTNAVKESIGEGCVTAYLIQIDNPGNRKWERLDMEIWDQDGNYGAATVFND